MRKINLNIVLILAALIGFNGIVIPRTTEKAKIKIALILDTSGSMNGLIDQARSQLWQTVNDLSLAQYEGQSVDIEIALYEYGNDNISYDQGYIRKLSDLTTDLDKISEDLFSLTTNGGSEYCGLAIQKSLEELNWGHSNDDLKLIFIAGNEPFSQGYFSYEKACKNSISKGIIVNTIHCGNEQQGIAQHWAHASELADGTFVNIDQNQQTVYVPTPFDNDIASLNEQLNTTYLAYGSEGEKRRERQLGQDKSASKIAPGNMVQRTIAKSSKAYKNEQWDLIDASDDKDFEIAQIETESLPEEMQQMDEEERIEYIESKKNERSEIKKKIQKLSNQRAQFLAENEKNKTKEDNLNSAMSNAIVKQAKEKNYDLGQQ